MRCGAIKPGEVVEILVRRGASRHHPAGHARRSGRLSDARARGGRIVAALRGAFAREEGREELLRTAAEKIRGSGAPYTSVYLYMLHGTSWSWRPLPAGTPSTPGSPSALGSAGPRSPAARTRTCLTCAR